MPDIYYAAAIVFIGIIQYSSNKRDFYSKKRKK